MATPGRPGGTLAAVRRTIARFDTDEVPGARVRVTMGAATTEVVADDEGYVDGFEVVKEGPQGTLRLQLKYHDAEPVIE